MYVLETRNVTKSFGEGEARVDAVRNVDLAVEAGTMLAIMGRSGSGKSTLLYMLGGIEMPTSGEVLLEGIDLASLGDDERTLMRRRRIGFIFQSFNLLPTFTAIENVALPLLLDGLPSNEANRRARDKLDLVELGHRANHLPSAMSGGEQQRTAIARALAIEPAFLLADEPTGNLDSASGRNVLGLLRRLIDEGGQTIVMVTHDPGVAAQSDRLVRMRDGMLESDSRPRAPSPEPALVEEDA
jgi:putative ABC transport system ATP-binding protein